ncbi:MAG: DUF3015 family protein [Bacteriovoracaceae bacterium]|nr:DUF3015 family protein [Bacteriovoracaceae bacterium]
MKKLLLTMLAFGMMSAANAASYQAQGCGLGSTIWTDGSSLVHQILGATTNGLSGNQTFGMTSGTSNCELDGAGGQAQTVFIEANKVALSNDIARGNGTTLASLTKMYGCSNVDAVGTVLQKRYEEIFPSQNAAATSINSKISNIIDETKACI